MSTDKAQAPSDETLPEAVVEQTDDHAVVFEFLRRRDKIRAKTREQLADRVHDDDRDPLAHVDPAVRQQAEDAYYLEQGKRRYKTSDGRTLFLTPEEIAQRQRARTQRRRTNKRPRFYGPASDNNRFWMTWGFNIAAVLLGLVVVWLILH